MRPVFDRRSQLAGWRGDDDHLFDTSMRWVGFIRRGALFTSTCVHVGWAEAGWLTDGHQLAMARHREARPMALATPPVPPIPPVPPVPPVTPVPPVPPIPPVPIMTPLRGWSHHSFAETMTRPARRRG